MDHVYEALANLLEYPGEEWGTGLEMCRQHIERGSSELARPFLEFYRAVEGFSVDELQELYTVTFDLNPVCALEVGYHLFGEDYKRGVFLANLRETEAPFDLGQEGQLPDYLPVLLRLLAVLEDVELRSDLIWQCLIPALEKMSASLARAQSLYGALVETTATALKREAAHPSARACATGHRRAVQLPVLEMKGGFHV
jgi:nitrate reductase delta subunit